MFDLDSKVPKGWNYVNLGMGNHLIVLQESEECLEWAKSVID